MAQECPICKQTDIADGAVKCHHCGSWLDPQKKTDEFEAFRHAMREEVSKDLATHRGLLENALSRVKNFATAIVAIAAAVTVYFGFSTDQSVKDIGEDIAAQATLKLSNVREEALANANARVDTQLASLEFQNAVREKIDASVEEAVASAVLARTQDIGASVEAKLASELASVEASVDSALEQAKDLASTAVTKLDEATRQQLQAQATATQAEAAVSDVQVIRASFSTARDLRVEETAERFEFETVDSSPKGSLSRLPELMERRVNALTFVLGGFYVPEISWKYLEYLTRMSEFQYVVLLAEDRSAIGYWDARELAAALNPPNNVVLSARHADDLGSLPDPEQLPEWVAFVDMLPSDEPGPLTALAGFTGMERFVEVSSSNLDALRVMAEVKQDSLPVLEPDGRLAGFVDRSRLTTTMLLKIATTSE